MSFYRLLPSVLRTHEIEYFSWIDYDQAVCSEEFKRASEKYRYWIKNKFNGSMAYLDRGQERRLNPRLVFEEVQSVMTLAFPYSTIPIQGPDTPTYARYLRGNDYHHEIKSRLESVMQSLHKGLPDLRWKVCVDTSAVLERTWASLSGLGWIGKNGMLIHPQLGSYFFIAVIFVNQKTDQGVRAAPNLCGSCTRCIDACPTNAFIDPPLLDSNKCISYLTLEHREDWPRELIKNQIQNRRQGSKKLGKRIAGCDICQEVCPFNSKRVKGESGVAEKNNFTQTWIELLEESKEDYRVRVKSTALSRVKPHQFSKNLAIALHEAVQGGELEKSEKIYSLIQKRCELSEDEQERDFWKCCLKAIKS